MAAIATFSPLLPPLLSPAATPAGEASVGSNLDKRSMRQRCVQGVRGLLGWRGERVWKRVRDGQSVKARQLAANVQRQCCTLNSVSLAAADETTDTAALYRLYCGILRWCKSLWLVAAAASSVSCREFRSTHLWFRDWRESTKFQFQNAASTGYKLCVQLQFKFQMKGIL
eukprot:scaffold1945_cov189-Alexandrium_tamarense.AAC.3